MDGNNVFTAHAVETGISNGITTEIVSGIAEGTTIVTEATMSMPFSQMTPPQGGAGRSPFMPGPPDRGNNKKGGEKE